MNDALDPAPKPRHPGELIREILVSRDLTQADLAFILGQSPQNIQLILSLKRGVSPETSKALGAALGYAPDYFASLQNAYDVACANDPNPAIGVRAKLFLNYPVRDMIKRGWIMEADAEGLRKQLAKFFDVANPEETPLVAHAAKKTSYTGTEISPAQLAWIFRVRQMAKQTYSAKYSPKALHDALTKLHALTIEPEEARHVPRILAECGVRLFLVESLPSAKIDGVCLWLDKNSPIIGMSLRHDRIDNFWFVLRHEIEHVLRGDGMAGAILDAELEGARASSTGDLPEEEKAANAAASNFCVPAEKIESFILRKHPFYYEKDVLAFSKLNGIHPGLVVGQIQFRLNRYDYLRKYQVRIRQHVLPGSMVDGWGQVAPTESAI